MHWILALSGIIFGGLFGHGDTAVPSLLFGGLLGWLWGKNQSLRTRLSALENQFEQFRLKATRETPVPSAPTTTPEPEATSPLQEIEPVAPIRVPEVVIPAPSIAPALITEEPVDPVPAATTAQPSPGIAPSIDDEPNALEHLTGMIRGWLFGGNLPVKIGVLVLLFGVAAALKYSVEAGLLHIPMALRLSLMAAGGLAIVGWGWRQRLSRPAFGLSLQGGGIGILLLVNFAAYRLYHLLPANAAFVMVIVLVAGAAALAVLQNTMALAVLGFLGGYLAPVLLSTGHGNHVALFSFYAVLNVCVFAIAWRRHWRLLNLIGFFFTFGVGMAWGWQYYRPEHFATVEPFLILFFLFYVGISVLDSVRAAPTHHTPISGTLLFGTPLVASALQAALLHDQPMAMAWSALLVAFLYAGLGFWLIRHRQLPLPGRAFAVLAVGFATMAIPLAFSSRTTSMTWALEGTALIWLGLRQRRGLLQLSGVALHVLAALAYGFYLLDQRGWSATDSEWPILNAHTLTVVILATTAMAISRLFEHGGKSRGLVWPGFLIGLGWWMVAGIREIAEHFSLLHGHHHSLSSQMAWLGFLAISLTLMAGLRRFLPWPRLGWAVTFILIFSLLPALFWGIESAALLHSPLLVYWLVWALAALYALAQLREPRQRGLGLSHVLFLGILSLVLGQTLLQMANAASLGQDWGLVASLLPLIALLFLTARHPAIGAFPLTGEFSSYALYWFIPAGVALAWVGVFSLGLRGDTAPLPYVPVLNPVELLQLFALLWLAQKARQQPKTKGIPALVILAWLVLSVIGARAVHHYQPVPWSLTDLLTSGSLHATLTVLWAIAGVLAWVLGSHRQLWGVWLAGAIVMGVVLIKLALIDRHYIGNLAGIVSFMAVGGLLVLVGRIAPTPPRQPTTMSQGTP